MPCRLDGACKGHCFTPYQCGLDEHGRFVDTEEHEPTGVWFCGPEPVEPKKIPRWLIGFTAGAAFIVAAFLLGRFLA